MIPHQFLWLSSSELCHNISCRVESEESGVSLCRALETFFSSSFFLAVRSGQTSRCESVCVASPLQRWQRTGGGFLTQCGDANGRRVSVRVERRRDGREWRPLVLLASFQAMEMRDNVRSGAWRILSPWWALEAHWATVWSAKRRERIERCGPK